jgi:AcrR family transcriptional regulator
VAQVQKPELRERMIAAALEVFAESGYERATMAKIAERAGGGAASLYRYFSAKDELFAAAIPAEIVREFRQLVARRVRALGSAQLGDPDHTAEAMLRFWVRHRLAVVVLLDRAAGTPYASFGRSFVAALVRLTVAQLRAANPGLRLDAAERFTLQQIFENTRAILAAILARHANEAAMRRAIAAFWSYQVAGLHGFAAYLNQLERRA